MRIDGVEDGNICDLTKPQGTEVQKEDLSNEFQAKTDPQVCKIFKLRSGYNVLEGTVLCFETFMQPNQVFQFINRNLTQLRHFVLLKNKRKEPYSQQLYCAT
ncbi:hypothetical protein M758_9G110900 [Ceratodon purpureus]|nr:hypothetical protein M758_9G110900 [Ceratodon purpureus]